MPSVPYIDGSGAQRQRATASGDGSTASPDTFSFIDRGVYDRLGDTSSSPINTPSDNGTISSTIRGLWKNLLGSVSDSASATGSIHAKFRALIEGFGLLTDSSAQSGSLLAMVRYLAESNFIEAQAANAITINTSFTTLIAFDCRAKSILGMQLENTGSTALSGLQVQARFHSNSNIWNTIASTNADFSTNNGKQSNNANAEIINSSENLLTIPSGGDGWFRMQCKGMESVRVRAKVASGSTTMLASGILEK